MKKNTHSPRLRFATLVACCATLLSLHAPTSAQAQPDYPPAIWRPAFSGHWYTSGFGHKFVVIHDMEGYYWSTIAYFQQSSTSASAHYCINGLKDAATDSAPGEITQMVRDAHYAWHALC